MKRSLTNTWFDFIYRLKLSDRILLHLLLGLVLFSLLNFLIDFSDKNTVTIPVSGGTIREGLIGTPRFINPILATNQAERDISALVYSGILNYNEEGNLVPDLAGSVEFDDDTKSYFITIREDANFHDGTKVTAFDVAFTFNLVKNPAINSPLFSVWENIAIEAQNETDLVIAINTSKEDFDNHLTTGILPQHLWDTPEPENIMFNSLNMEPIGSGPYKFFSISESRNGSIDHVHLKNKYNNTAVKDLYIVFFSNQLSLLEALKNGDIDSAGNLSSQFLGELDANQFTTDSIVLPRVFNIFFNQNRSDALRSNEVRTALNLIINRQSIINDAMNSFAVPTETPIPPTINNVQFHRTASSEEDFEDILLSAGWEKNEQNTWQKDDAILALTIRTLDTPQFENIANAIAAQWTKAGIEVRVEVFRQTDLLNTIIRPRDFEVLLFGIEISRSNNLYPFFHSSQQIDPGLNIAQYANIQIDNNLDLLQNSSKEERVTALKNILAILDEELPLIPILSPTYNYVYNSEISILLPKQISSPHDRFSLIKNWHKEKEELWNVFQYKNITN